MEKKFDFIVPSMKNEIIYHVEYKNNGWYISWESQGEICTDTTDEKELRDYIGRGFWKKIITNKNRRLE